MFDRIIYISDNSATIKLKAGANLSVNLMNLHIVLEDNVKKILGEVNNVNGDTIDITFLGEFCGDKFLSGTIRKPRLDATIRIISRNEMALITGKDDNGYILLGETPFYEGVPIYLDVNNFLSQHFAIMGNSGSGKSCGVSRIFQNIFNSKKFSADNANILMIDSSGEYYNAFNNLNSVNPKYHYRFISTNTKNKDADLLQIPIYLLNTDDLALLLQATSHSQLPIIERMRKLALVFSQNDVNANAYKNHLIAKAIMSILYTNETAPNKRNEIFSVLASCSTNEFNLEAVLQGIGYTRKFRECFLIDSSGEFTESILLTEYVSSFIDDKLDVYEPNDGVYYDLDTLEKALNFTLISEGWLRNKNTYSDSITIKVRLHSLIVSENSRFFDVKSFMTLRDFILSLFNFNEVKYQFVNINLDDLDDTLAKVITKIYSRLIFDFAKSSISENTVPFHLVIEEAHRYIQNDNDTFLIGYNIFERIAKEGRKYGVILGIITQRPVELSDTVISQCSNFLIFKINHPVDVDYIRKMIPNISDAIVEKQKTLQSGTCLGFGSAFKIPLIAKLEMPNPSPRSKNCDVLGAWANSDLLNVDIEEKPIIRQNIISPIMTNKPSLNTNMNSSMNLGSNVDTYINRNLNLSNSTNNNDAFTGAPTIQLPSFSSPVNTKVEPTGATNLVSFSSSKMNNIPSNNTSNVSNVQPPKQNGPVLVSFNDGRKFSGSMKLNNISKELSPNNNKKEIKETGANIVSNIFSRSSEKSNSLLFSGDKPKIENGSINKFGTFEAGNSSLNNSIPTMMNNEVQSGFADDFDIPSSVTVVENGNNDFHKLNLSDVANLGATNNFKKDTFDRPNIQCSDLMTMSGNAFDGYKDSSSVPNVPNNMVLTDDKIDFFNKNN